MSTHSSSTSSNSRSSATPPPSPKPQGSRQLSGKAAVLAPLAIDIALPLAVYWLLTSLGLSTTTALLLSGLVPVIRIVKGIVKGQGIEWLAVFVLTMLATSVVLSLVEGDDRYLLAKDALFIFVVGAWCLATLFFDKPMVFHTVRVFVTGGDTTKDEQYDRAWQVDPKFRAIMRRLTVAWGVGLIIDSAIRLVIDYRVDLDSAVYVQHIPLVVIVVSLMIATRLCGNTLRASMAKTA